MATTFLSRVVWALWTLTSALMVLSAVQGCGGSAHDFDRIAMPLRFHDVRNTAAWTADFRAEWWKPIDAAYERYDQSIELIVREQWEPFAVEATLARQQLNPGDATVAQTQWSKHQRIVRALTDAENGFCDDLARTLPKDAHPFVELLRARAAFWRASGLWPDASQRLAGPLEVLALGGVRPLDETARAAAVVAYSNLTMLADRARVRRAQNAIAYLEEVPDLEHAVRLAQGDARKTAEAARDARKNRYWGTERASADEALRLALVREGRAFASSLPDDLRREWFLERLDASLHDGVRSSASIRAFGRLARRVIEREKPDDAALLAEYVRVETEVLERQRVLRTGLDSGSPAERKRTFEALAALPAGLVEVIKRAVSDEILWKLAIGTLEIEAGERSEDEVLESALLKAAPPKDAAPPAIPAVSEEMHNARDRGMRVILGYPLSPVIVRELAARLQLSEADTGALAELGVRETTRVIEVSAESIESIKTGFEKLGEDQRALEPAVAIAKFMAQVRAVAARVRESDRAANEMMLTRAAELASIAADDPRLEVARMELELLSAVGTDSINDEAEAIGGLTPEALVSPFEVLRRMRMEPAQRSAAEDIVLAQRDALLAAALSAREEILSNVARFLVVLLEAQKYEAELKNGVFAAPSKAKKFWRPNRAGARAVELRFALANELATALGEQSGQSYRAAFRALTEPALSPPQPRAFWELDAYAAGRGMDRVARETSSALRDSLAAVLDAADERRARAELALHEWRGQWVRLESLHSNDEWLRVGFASPLAALLRSRASDADERAFAACAALLDFADAPAEALRALERRPVVLPRAMKPYFP